MGCRKNMGEGDLRVNSLGLRKGEANLKESFGGIWVWGRVTNLDGGSGKGVVLVNLSLSHRDEGWTGKEKS